MSPESTYLLQSLGTVALFGGALWGATALLRRASAPPKDGPLEVLARQQLDGRRAIYLVRIGKRVLIIGATDAALTKLGTTSLASLELPAASEPRASFGDWLAKVRARRDKS